MYLDQLPEAEKPAFVELPRLKAERTATVPEVPVMCIKNGNGLSAEREEGADKILDYYRASKGAFLCIQKNKRILHYGYIIKQSL